MDVHTSKTKRAFAEIQEKVLRDATAGSMSNPLCISGASLAGKKKQAAVWRGVAQLYSGSAFVTYNSLTCRL